MYRGVGPAAGTAFVLPQSSQMEEGVYAVALAVYEGL